MAKMPKYICYKVVEEAPDGYRLASVDSESIAEVTRCRDCKNWFRWGELIGHCRREFYDDNGRYKMNVETFHDDYCSYGERKDG